MNEVEAVALKPCPFCAAPAEIEQGIDHHGEWFNLGCSRHWGKVKDPNPSNTCIAGRMFYTEIDRTEAEAIAAWNTRADAAPTPKADEVEAVGFAMWKAEADRAAPNVGKNRTIENYRYDLDPIGRAKWDQIAQAAIAALDAARGDRVAQVVEWLRKENGLCDCHARCETECGCGAWDDWKTKPLLEIADAIERGEPFNG